MRAAPRRCGRALQEFHCRLSAGSEATHCRSSTAHCRQALWQCIAGLALPTAFRQCGSVAVLQKFDFPLSPSGVALHYTSCTAPCRQAVRQCIVGVELPTATEREALHCRGCAALHQFHFPRPPGGVAVHCRSSTTQCPQALWQCIAGVALPTTPKQCGSALQHLHCPLPRG